MASPDLPDEAPRRVIVFHRYDEFGRPCELVEVDEEAAGHWDARQWRDKPTL